MIDARSTEFECDTPTPCPPTPQIPHNTAFLRLLKEGNFKRPYLAQLAGHKLRHYLGEAPPTGVYQ